MATTAAPALHLATDDLRAACGATVIVATSPDLADLRIIDDRDRVTCTACRQLPALRFVFSAKTSTWAIFCDSDYCEGRELEDGFHLLTDAVEETASHHCENEAEAAYDRRYDMNWSRPA